MVQTINVQLATGNLKLELEPGHVPIKRLLGFAARVSSKRKFLLVSKILGKHYPVTPKVMRWSYRALIKKIADIEFSSSIWIGMAETATGLGYGVFAEACHQGFENQLFMQTTRYHLEGMERLEFDEAHSHATDFFLYYPEKTESRKLFLSAHTLVLIDDEISTGRTFLQLINAFRKVNPFIQQVIIVSLVNFTNPVNRRIVEQESGIAISWIALRQGQLNFEDHHNSLLDNININVSSNHSCKKHLMSWPGRLGLSSPIKLSTNTVSHLKSFFKATDDIRPLLVLGTGECNAPAFLLGTELENQNFNVKVQSTTRSPIHIGNDIRSICHFEDNYEDGIANFIYNMNPDDYREIIICHETTLNLPLKELMKNWNAISAHFQLVDSKDAIFNFAILK